MTQEDEDKRLAYGATVSAGWYQAIQELLLAREHAREAGFDARMECAIETVQSAGNALADHVVDGILGLPAK